MKMLVCVKQVPVSEAVFSIDDSTSRLKPAAGIEYRMNRFDEYAVEAAVRIKEAFYGSTIDVLSVGPQRAEAVIRRAMGMGADNGIHISVPDHEFYDPLALAAWIAALARGEAYDLIFSGVMSEDLMQGQVGLLTAELLGMPFASAVVSISLSPAESAVQVEREVEGGIRECLALKLPALLTLQTGIHKPRYPSLSNLLRANRQSLRVVDAGSLAQPEKRQAVQRLRPPQRSRNGIFLVGSPAEKAERLITILKERSLWMPA